MWALHSYKLLPKMTIKICALDLKGYVLSVIVCFQMIMPPKMISKILVVHESC